MTLYILNYNSYYNRIVKKYNTTQEYLDNVEVIYTLIDADFNPNDNVNASHTFGWSSNYNNFLTGDNYTGRGNYMIAVDDNKDIVSRWFILDSVRVRDGQWTLSLRRDLIAEYYEAVVDAPCFIEKATLSLDDPMIYNSENMTYNQIKTNEILLQDKSKCPWIVGYYAKNAEDLQGTVKTNELVDVPAINIDTPINNWVYSQYQENPFLGISKKTDYEIRVANSSAAAGAGYKFLIDSNSGSTEPYFDNSLRYESLKTGPDVVIIDANIENYLITNNNILTNMKNSIPSYAPIATQEDVNELLSFNGQLIRDTNGEVYLVDIYSERDVTSTYSVTSGILFNYLKDMTSTLTYEKGLTSGTSHLRGSKIFTGSVGNGTFKLKIVTSAYRVGLTRQEQYELKYDLTSSTKIITEDAPYNLFAIPYGEITIVDEVNNRTFTTSADIGLNTASTIQGLETTSNIYDLQLVPFCPVQELITDDKVITVDKANQFSLITFGEGETLEVRGIIFNVSRSTFDFNIPYNISIGTTALERKVNNECDKWRLTSPNYSNYFDFSVEKNNGVQYFNVDISYKPYTPYIHINPNFDGLYGYDDNSPRGLVLGGDFSLSQIVNDWQEYQIQNKNFQNIFDRQIQNMEVKNNIQRTTDIVSAVTGTIQGTSSGAVSGAMMSGGSPIGAIVGGVVGAGASLAGGIADIKMNEQLRNEALDYAKDMYSYNLGNIQALPQTLSKVSSFNANNKIFPVLEYYTATDIEKEALKDKIKYNGMTVMRIGKINDFIDYNDYSYTKGKLIRLNLEDWGGEDYHILNSIAYETNLGFFIKKEDTN